VRASLLWWKWRLFLVNLIAFSLSPLQGWEGESEGPLEERRGEDGGRRGGQRRMKEIQNKHACLLFVAFAEVRRSEKMRGENRFESRRGKRRASRRESCEEARQPTREDTRGNTKRAKISRGRTMS
jgi:hypothetical protein